MTRTFPHAATPPRPGNPVVVAAGMAAQAVLFAVRVAVTPAAYQPPLVAALLVGAADWLAMLLVAALVSAFTHLARAWSDAGAAVRFSRALELYVWSCVPLALVCVARIVTMAGSGEMARAWSPLPGWAGALLPVEKLVQLGLYALLIGREMRPAGAPRVAHDPRAWALPLALALAAPAPGAARAGCADREWTGTALARCAWGVDTLRVRAAGCLATTHGQTLDWEAMQRFFRNHCLACDPLAFGPGEYARVEVAQAAHLGNFEPFDDLSFVAVQIEVAGPLPARGRPGFRLAPDDSVVVCDARGPVPVASPVALAAHTYPDTPYGDLLRKGCPQLRYWLRARPLFADGEAPEGWREAQLAAPPVRNDFVLVVRRALSFRDIRRIRLCVLGTGVELRPRGGAAAPGGSGSRRDDAERR